MAQYLFVLGRNPELSLLELMSYCKRKGLSYTLIEHKEDIALLEIQTFDSQKAIKDLGGTIKIGMILTNSLQYQGTKNKVTYAINYHKADPMQMEGRAKELLDKEELKAIRRYGKTKNILPSKARTLDFEFIAYRDKLFLRTAISNPKEYKARDELRPFFDPLKVTSIRLAKILINLAQPKTEILDPFCGNGTFLQEALLMGLQAKGGDVHIQDAQKNLTWLEKKYPAIKKKWQLFQGDAGRISKWLSTVECVVTEPYLGPFLKKPLSYEETIKIAKHLRELYLKTLEQLHKIVQGKVVILFPQLLTKEKKKVNLAIEDLLKQTKFKIDDEIKIVPLPLLYNERKNNVQRLIYILKKQ